MYGGEGRNGGGGGAKNGKGDCIKQILIVVEGDMNAKIIFKGNDEHGCLYVGGNDGPMRRVLSYVNDEWTLVMMARYAAQVGEMTMMLCNWVGKEMANKIPKLMTNFLLCLKLQVNQSQTKLRLGGVISELSEDDEIFVASDDASEEETTKKGCDEGNIGKGSTEGNYDNDNIPKRKNRVGERIEQKLASAYKKMDCITAVKCYSFMLVEFSMELTNNLKANIWVYDYIHPIYKTATHQFIYDQLVHPIEAYNMRKVNDRIGLMVGGEELDEDYNRCILPPINGRHPGRPSSKHRESQTQDKKVRRQKHDMMVCCVLPIRGEWVTGRRVEW
ncbi:hypothetical protein Cgig2_000817 [Carnegiea gigantea]|uniref:Uncharacterized protein n=1 Tax=Carnegiea gigantea TaxID=171969 RepID=A0A9Q1QJ44_9CARY|nr:hypothetical protein Cgig2_000817 [Carnegiea gigantea]